MKKRIMSMVLAICMIFTFVPIVRVVSAADDSTNNDYSVISTITTACEAIDKDYTYNGSDLGATYTPYETTFKLWAPTAEKVRLNLYTNGSDKEEGAEVLGTYELSYTEGTGV